MNNSYLSIAIPTYNSSGYLLRLLKKIEKFNSVNEIVIQDDFSTGEEFKNINKIVKRFNKKKFEIKVLQNKKNLGAFLNKINAISNCKNEFVYQIDSDNLPGKNLDRIFKSIIYENKSNVIYYPSQLIQTIDSSYFKKLKYTLLKDNKIILSKDDKFITLNSFKNAITKNDDITFDKNYRWILNCGNFIVNKKKFQNVFEVSNIEVNEYYVLDAVAINYYWLKNQGQVKLLKDHYHYHKKREDSVSILNADKTLESFDYFEKKIISI